MGSGMQSVNVIERAFQIAPECGSLADVRHRLNREGYQDVDAHLSGKHIRDQIHDRLDPRLKKPRNGKRPGGARELKPGR